MLELIYSPFLTIAYAALSFLLGSIPFGVLIGRAFYKTDIRSSGSGNIGAANALRTYGGGGAVAVLVLDALKGFLPATGALLLTAHQRPGFAALAVLAAVAGHCWSPWLGMRGGKGVATWLGGVIAMSIPAAAVFGVVWFALVIPTRFASLGSLAATLLSAVALAVLTRDAGVAVASLLTVAVIFWKHRQNIVRLWTHTENRLTFGGSDEPEIKNATE